jgi:hypothetical protein
MPPVVFEPTISAAEGPQTYALGRAVTGTGRFRCAVHKMHVIISLSVAVERVSLFLLVVLEILGSNRLSKVRYAANPLMTLPIRDRGDSEVTTGILHNLYKRVVHLAVQHFVLRGLGPNLSVIYIYTAARGCSFD